MSDLKLGVLIDEKQQRDAIHIAVAPVIAAEILAPGDNIGWVQGEDGPLRVQRRVAGAIGIVDPFLKGRVVAGDRFWMFLYPQTITSLRHDWTHPAFEAAASVALTAKQESEAWLREFVKTHDCPGYETVLAAALDEHEKNRDDYDEYMGSTNDGEYLFFRGRDAHGEIPPEFWDHVSNIAGRDIPKEKRATSFSCSC